MWQGVSVVERPKAIDLVPLETLKRWLFVEHSDDDDLLERMLNGAIARIDGPQGIGVAMLRQTWCKSLDCFRQCILLPGAPVKSIASVTYLDRSGEMQTLDPASYHLDPASEPARLVAKPGYSWPSTASVPGAVKVNYVLGEESPDDVPGDLIDAVAMIVAHRHANREAVSDAAGDVVPMGAEWILSEHARCRVAS